MKNVFSNVTVGAVIVSVSMTAFAAGVKDNTKGERSKDVIAKEIEAANKSLRAAGSGVVKELADKMEPIVKRLAETGNLDSATIAQAAKNLGLNAVNNVKSALGSGNAKQVKLAELTVKVASKLSGTDLEVALVDVLARGANKDVAGEIFSADEKAFKDQIDQATELANKLLESGSTRGAIADFLSSKHKKDGSEAYTENSDKVKEFIETLGRCAGRKV
ncbi:MAG: hypothetical protein A4S09_16485 [Proteobacteria bacterium SG_bin7]|nr:MAG: hypothetical protein A4S09_16485 [Proteobacteria bacterium SG_bin7]